MSRRPRLALSFLIVLLLAVALLAGREESPSALVRFEGYTMGTSYSVQYLSSPALPQTVILEEGVAALLYTLDKGIFSTYEESSELMRLNRAEVGETVPVSPELAVVLGESLRLARLTGGALDVTVAPLVDLWGFGPGKNANNSAVPSVSDIEAARNRLGYEQLSFDETKLTVVRQADVSIDLSAIAKGFGVDAIADYLEAEGVTNYFIEVGGELRISGAKDASGRGWVPAIEAPVATGAQLYDAFFSGGDSIAVAGSGDYRNYFEVDGQRYSHEIDPRSGRPIDHALAAVYVIDSLAMTADGLATAYMVLGPEAARDAAQAQGQAAYFIVRTGANESGQPLFEHFTTPEFERYLR